MSLGSERHLAVLGELAEWWEDLWQRGIGSHVVLVPVPPGWGRSALLSEFKAVVEDDDGPVRVVVFLDGGLPGRAVQADGLVNGLAAAAPRSRAAELLGLGSAAGRVQLGLGVGGLFVSGMAVAASVLVASLAVTAAGNAWDGSPAGEAGAVARAARAVAAVSVSVPVVVIIDDADLLEPGMAVTLIRNLAGRYDGQVLVVAAAGPDSDLRGALTSDPGFELGGRVDCAEAADPGMGYRSRADLAGELHPDLPAAALERIARRTRTFEDVFAVAAADRLAELAKDTDAAAMLAGVDAVVDASLDRAKPSREATVLAWAGGALSVGQVDQALAILGVERQESDQHVTRSGSLARLADPADPRLSEQVAALSATIRRELAGAVLSGAIKIAKDPEAGLIERVIARQAAHYVRTDLDDRSGLARIQSALIRGLEKLGDPEAAHEVATAALAELPPVAQGIGERQELLMAVLRLARTRPRHGHDPLVEEAIAAAIAGGAAVSLEGRLWAAVDLLGRASRRDAGRQLAEQVAAELETRGVRGAAADQWRLLLAFHAGCAGYPGIAQRLLSTMISTGSVDQQEAAQAVLYTVGGQQADTRLQIVMLETELSETTSTAGDDRLRLHTALAADYHTLGEYQQAVRHGNQELALRRHVQGPCHPETLTTRSKVALWTGRCGDAAQALRLSEELLADQVRVLGAENLDTLATRNNIAHWTGACGDSAQALRLSEGLLADKVRVLGPSHPDTLTTRANIAFRTGACGDSARALGLYKELLPDLVRVLGANHPDTLIARNNLARQTGRSGDTARAIRLAEQLLADQIRVLGPDHPDTLTARNTIAYWTGASGDFSQALRLSEELLPDQIRVLGPDHPDTLTTRNIITAWTGRSGDSPRALRLSEELLPDQVRVLGADHPETLITRNSIAQWTGVCGHPVRALRLSEELVPDQIRVLGPDHPDTLTTRNNIAHWTGTDGDPARALRLYEELLPDQIRVLGPNHPDTLTTRNNIAHWTGTDGDPARALRLYEELLPDQIRVLGPNHAETLRTRKNIASLAKAQSAIGFLDDQTGLGDSIRRGSTPA
jgi:hypothetical protein